MPFSQSCKSGPGRNRNDSSSSYHCATVNKKRKVVDFEFEIVQRNVRSSKEETTRTNIKPAVIKGVKKPTKRPHLYLGRLSQNITASEMAVLRRKERRTTSYSPNFEVSSSPESLPLCI